MSDVKSGRHARTDLLIGDWHGKGGKYLVYGLYNGVIISLEALLGTAHPSKNRSFPLLSPAVSCICRMRRWRHSSLSWMT